MTANLPTTALLLPLQNFAVPHRLDAAFDSREEHYMQIAREISIGNLRMGGNQPLVLIAGPCVIESEAHAMLMAERLAEAASHAKVPFIFKASYDKANRSSEQSYRGPGLTEGLRILQKIKEAS